jgi:hypothetical protein
MSSFGLLSQIKLELYSVDTNVLNSPQYFHILNFYYNSWNFLYHFITFKNTTHTHTQTYIYMSECVCVCVCVCARAHVFIYSLIYSRYKLHVRCSLKSQLMLSLVDHCSDNAFGCYLEDTYGNSNEPLTKCTDFSDFCSNPHTDFWDSMLNRP